MFEARQIGHEFVTTPCLWFSRGEPKAKLLGALSLVRFFGANKEMNVRSFSYAAVTRDERNTADERFWTVC